MLKLLSWWVPTWRNGSFMNLMDWVANYRTNPAALILIPVIRPSSFKSKIHLKSTVLINEDSLSLIQEMKNSLTKTSKIRKPFINSGSISRKLLNRVWSHRNRSISKRGTGLYTSKSGQSSNKASYFVSQTNWFSLSSRMGVRLSSTLTKRQYTTLRPMVNFKSLRLLRPCEVKTLSLLKGTFSLNKYSRRNLKSRKK